MVARPRQLLCACATETVLFCARLRVRVRVRVIRYTSCRVRSHGRGGGGFVVVVVVVVKRNVCTFHAVGGTRRAPKICAKRTRINPRRTCRVAPQITTRPYTSQRSCPVRVFYVFFSPSQCVTDDSLGIAFQGGRLVYLNTYTYIH